MRHTVCPLVILGADFEGSVTVVLPACNQ